MKTIFLLTVVLFALACEAKVARASWNYNPNSKTGPKGWGDFSDTCASGMRQSPVDIPSADRIMVKPSLRPLLLNYKYVNASVFLSKKTQLSDIDVNDIRNTGNAVVVRYPAGSTARLHGGKNGRYALKQFHFHTPSEHTINGKRFAMEVHVVHQNKAGRMAIVALLFQEGSENKFLNSLGWSKLPTKAGKKRALSGVINVLKAFPFNHFYASYKGSLTSPPCTEGVKWFVLSSPISASRKQLRSFARLFGKSGNARPVQALNGRRVVVPELPVEDALLGY